MLWFYELLEGYAGLLVAPAECFGQSFFCTSGKKRAFNAVCAYFRPFLVFSSNLLKRLCLNELQQEYCVMTNVIALE